MGVTKDETELERRQKSFPRTKLQYYQQVLQEHYFVTQILMPVLQMVIQSEQIGFCYPSQDIRGKKNRAENVNYGAHASQNHLEKTQKPLLSHSEASIPPGLKFSSNQTTLIDLTGGAQIFGFRYGQDGNKRGTDRPAWSPGECPYLYKYEGIFRKKSASSIKPVSCFYC